MEQDAPEEGLSAWQRYLERFSEADPARTVVARCRLARLHDELGHTREASRATEEALAAYDALPQWSPEAAHAAAELALPALEEAHADFLSRGLTGRESKDARLLMETLPAELMALDAQAEAYMTRFRHLEHLSAALVLGGTAWLHYSDLLYSVSQDDPDLFRSLQADQVEARGLERLILAVDQSRRARQHNDWVGQAVEILNQRAPEAWPLERQELPGE